MFQENYVLNHQFKRTLIIYKLKTQKHIHVGTGSPASVQQTSFLIQFLQQVHLLSSGFIINIVQYTRHTHSVFNSSY